MMEISTHKLVPQAHDTELTRPNKHTLKDLKRNFHQKKSAIYIGPVWVLTYGEVSFTLRLYLSHICKRKKIVK